MTSDRFAFICLEAQRIHEESYTDYPGFSEFLAKVSRGEITKYAYMEPGYYQINLYDSARYACYENREDSRWADVISFLNYNNWNDIQIWAEQFNFLHPAFGK